MIAKLLTLAAASALAFTSVSAHCARNYTVKSGDVCDTISSNNGVSSYQLRIINPDINSKCSNLYPSQQLCLGWAGADCTNTYTVAKGDYCERIATGKGISLDTFFANNKLIDRECKALRIGETVCVDSKVITYGPTGSGSGSSGSGSSGSWVPAGSNNGQTGSGSNDTGSGSGSGSDVPYSGGGSGVYSSPPQAASAVQSLSAGSPAPTAAAPAPSTTPAPTQGGDSDDDEVCEYGYEDDN